MSILIKKNYFKHLKISYAGMSPHVRHAGEFLILIYTTELWELPD